MQPTLPPAEPDPIDFATNLWDGFEVCVDRVKIALKTFDELNKFLKERGSIEERFASGLKSLCSHTGMLPEEGSIGAAWKVVKEEHERIAAAHKKLATDLNHAMSVISGEDAKVGQKLKQLEAQGNQVIRNRKNALELSQKTRIRYAKAFDEWDQADYAAKEAADEPGARTERELLKIRKTEESTKKAMQEAMQAHRAAVEAAQLAQTEAEKNLAIILREIQQLELERIESMRSCLRSFLIESEKLHAAANACVATMAQNVERIDKVADLTAFMRSKRTGRTPEEHDTFVELVQKRVYQRKSGGPTPPASSSAAGAAVPPVPPAPTPSAGPLRIMYAMYAYAVQGADEVALSEGDKVELLEEDAAGPGWSRVRNTVSGKEGFCPHSYLDSSPPAPAAPSSGAGAAAAAAPNAPASAEAASDAKASAETPADGKKAVALYDFDATSETELSLKAGDELMVTDTESSAGWYYATNLRSNAVGYCPSSYCQFS